MKKLILLALVSFSLNIHSQVELKYLGTAGWEISDDNITVLIDPYISRVKLGNGPSVNKLDERKTVLRSDFFVSDSILIDSLIDKVVETLAKQNEIKLVKILETKKGAEYEGVDE